MTIDEEKVRARAELLWNELDDAGRAVLIDTLEELADAALTKQAEARKGGSIPWGWYRTQWLARCNHSVMHAFCLAARGR